MSYYHADWQIRTSADWRQPFSLADAGQVWDLTGATIVLRMRKRMSDATVDLTLTNDNGIVIQDAEGGIFAIAATAEMLSDLAAGQYDYELIITQGGIATALLSGTVKVEKGLA